MITIERRPELADCRGDMDDTAFTISHVELKSQLTNWLGTPIYDKKYKTIAQWPVWVCDERTGTKEAGVIFYDCHVWIAGMIGEDTDAYRCAVRDAILLSLGMHDYRTTQIISAGHAAVEAFHDRLIKLMSEDGDSGNWTKNINLADLINAWKKECSSSNHATVRWLSEAQSGLENVVDCLCRAEEAIDKYQTNQE